MPIEIKELFVRTFFGGMDYSGMRSGDSKQMEKNEQKNTNNLPQSDTHNEQDFTTSFKKLLDQSQER